MDEELKREVFDFMNSDEFLKNPKVRGKELNFRTFDQIYKLRYVTHASPMELRAFSTLFKLPAS